jgi:hypothetical protein
MTHPKHGPSRRRHEAALHTYLNEQAAAGVRLTESDVAEITHLFEVLAAPPLEPTPDGWVRDALPFVRTSGAGAVSESFSRPAIQEGLGATADHLRGAISRVLGILVLDSALGPIPGVRCAEPAKARQMLFAYPIGKLYLQIARETERVRILGQFVPADRHEVPEMRSVRTQGDIGASDAPLQPNGEFELDLPADAVVNLELCWGSTELVVEHLRL